MLDIEFNFKAINKSYVKYFKNYKRRVEVYYGGAGSGKSVFGIQKMVYKYLKSKVARKCIVVRKYASTIRETVYAEFKAVIEDWGLYKYCTFQDSYLKIRLYNDCEFIFKGMDDEYKIKSISRPDDILIEEGTDITLDEFTQLKLRLRSTKGDSQIIILYNPISKGNWVYKYFHEGKPLDSNNMYRTKDLQVLKTTYKDNKYLKDDYIKDLESLKHTNYNKYVSHVLAEFTALDKLIYTNYQIKKFERSEIITHLKESNKKAIALCGLDFGYINDPSAFLATIINETDKEVYIFDEFSEIGLLNPDIAKRIQNMGYSKEIIIADSAERKSIDELKLLYNLNRIKPAKKGSIVYGIQYVQQYKLIIHPKCINFIDEIKNYTWTKDKKTNEYTNKPIDTYNHLLDGLRYLLTYQKGINSISFA